MLVQNNEMFFIKGPQQLFDNNGLLKLIIVALPFLIAIQHS